MQGRTAAQARQELAANGGLSAEGAAQREGQDPSS